ncbi:MAG: polysaccharide biosynthesis tyrosine autokinase [Maribacter sp.]
MAKIKILDDHKKADVLPDEYALVNRNIRLNLESQIDVLRSYRLLSNVVSDLNLDIAHYRLKNIHFTKIWTPPYVVTKNISEDRLSIPKEYEIVLSSTGFNIEDKSGSKFIVPYYKSDTAVSDLPFTIKLTENINTDDYKNVKFKLKLSQIKQASLTLAEKLKITSSQTENDILTLSLNSESKEWSEAILNALIIKFDKDGILDRQLESKRTLEVIDKRFIYLSKELDSIEFDKQGFKQAKNLSYIEADAGVNLQRKSAAESEVLKLETQASLSNLLKETVANEADYNLLPSDIGLDNRGLNDLVSNYNQMASERQKLLVSMGSNHPTLQRLSKQMELEKLNILNTVNTYESQLGISLNQQNKQRNRAGYRFSKLPENERELRSIERQQGIKENLYLLLLKKREEAAINYAATSPSIKVIDYGLTNIKPIWPKKTIVFPISFLLGLFLPFIVLYIRFSLDDKIHDRFEIEKLNPEIPVLTEIPFFGDDNSFLDVNDRSILAESFRILSTNVNYLLLDKETNLGRVVYVTSAIKGEGKSLLARNLSIAFASMEKRVLLLGADLRNPQIHSYFNMDKNILGLSDYLANPKMDFKDCLHEGFGKNEYHKVCVSGTIPANAPVLLSGKRFEKFMELANKEFDYIIVDTAPAMLVTDTLLISKYADITLFTVRAGYSDKSILEFSKKLNKAKRLHNMAYVLNAVGHKGKNYNYGYGYGYDINKSSEPWYTKYFKNVRKMNDQVKKKVKNQVKKKVKDQVIKKVNGQVKKKVKDQVKENAL